MYQLKENSRRNIFVVNRSELFERFDALFYKERLNLDSYIKLSKIAKISGGKRIPKGFEFLTEKSPYRYLRVGDVSWDGRLDYDSFKYLSKEVYDILKRYEIFKDELLIAIVGATVGKVAILDVEDDCTDRIILTENCAKISISNNSVLPQFLLLILQSNIVQQQIKLNYIQTTLPKLGLDRVESLLIPPIPSIAMQTEIVRKYQAAFNEKQRKEAEAKELIKSIDAFLGSELQLCATESGSGISDRVFRVDRSFLYKRLDAAVYKPSFKFKSNIYEVHKLSDLVYINPQTSFNRLNPDSEISFVPMDAIDEENGVVKYFNKKRVYLSKGFTRFKNGDLIWAKITPCMQNGKSAVVYDALQGYACGSTEFYVIRPKTNDVIVEYVHLFLRDRRVLEYAQNYFGGSAGQQRVSKDFFANFQIPLPPRLKQLAILKHIDGINKKILHLRSEGDIGLEEAKQEIEQMILG